jgi:hypothetical protein
MTVEEVVTALCIAPQRSVEDARSLAPAEPGLYSWWAEPRSLPSEVPRDLHPETGLALLYVGIAPASATSRGNIRRRLRIHTRGAIGSSTLRRGLAALLYEDWGWRAIWASTRPGLESRDLAALSEWQAENLAVQWCVCEEPWSVEPAVVAAMAPPMNLEHNRGHAFHATISARRSDFRRAAEAQRDERSPPARRRSR